MRITTICMWCAMLCAWCACNNTEEPISETSQQIGEAVVKTSQLLVDKKELHKTYNDAACQAHIQYPAIKEFAFETIEQKINELLYQIFTQNTIIAKETCPPYSSNFKENVDYQVQLNDGNLLSIKMQHNEEGNHTAYPIVQTDALTLDVHEAQVLNLNKLFEPDSVPLGIIQHHVANKFKSLTFETDQSHLAQKTDFNYYLTSDKLVLLNLSEEASIAGIEIPIDFSEFEPHPTSILHRLHRRIQKNAAQSQELVLNQLGPIIAQVSGADSSKVTATVEIGSLIEGEAAWTELYTQIETTFGVKAPKIHGHLLTVENWGSFIEGSLTTQQKLKDLFAESPWEVPMKELTANYKVAELMKKTAEKMQKAASNSDVEKERKTAEELWQDFYFSLEKQFEISETSVAAYSGATETLADWALFIQNWPVYKESMGM